MSRVENSDGFGWRMGRMGLPIEGRLSSPEYERYSYPKRLALLKLAL